MVDKRREPHQVPLLYCDTQAVPVGVNCAAEAFSSSFLP